MEGKGVSGNGSEFGSSSVFGSSDLQPYPSSTYVDVAAAPESTDGKKHVVESKQMSAIKSGKPLKLNNTNHQNPGVRSYLELMIAQSTFHTFHPFQYIATFHYISMYFIILHTFHTSHTSHTSHTFHTFHMSYISCMSYSSYITYLYAHIQTYRHTDRQTDRQTDVRIHT